MFKFFHRKKKTLITDLGTRTPVERRALESLHLDVPVSLMDEILKNLSTEVKEELPEERKPGVNKNGTAVFRISDMDRKPSVKYSDSTGQTGIRRRITKR